MRSLNRRLIELRAQAIENSPPERVAALASVRRSISSKSRVRIRFSDGFYSLEGRTGTVHSPSWASLTPVDCFLQPPDIYCWQYQPSKGDVVIDIGAGDGSEALLFSRLVGPTGLVVAVEADPLVFRALTRTIESNEAHNVRLVNAAVSDTNGEILIQSSLDDWLKNSIVGGTGISVPSLTLNRLLSEQVPPDRRVALLTSNIEGAEGRLIRSAGAAAEVVDNWVVSCHDFRGQYEGGIDFRTYVQVWEWLDQRGYDLVGRPDTRPWVADTIYARRGHGR